MRHSTRVTAAATAGSKSSPPSGVAGTQTVLRIQTVRLSSPSTPAQGLSSGCTLAQLSESVAGARHSSVACAAVVATKCVITHLLAVSGGTVQLLLRLRKRLLCRHLLEAVRLREQVRGLNQLRGFGAGRGEESRRQGEEGVSAWCVGVVGAADAQLKPLKSPSHSATCLPAPTLMGLLASTTEPSALYCTGTAAAIGSSGAACAAAAAARLPVLTG